MKKPSAQLQTDFEDEMPEPSNQKEEDEGERGIIGREKSHGEIAEMLVDYTKHLYAISILSDKEAYVLVWCIGRAIDWTSRALLQEVINRMSVYISRGGQGRKDIMGPYERKTEEKKLQKLAGKVESLNI